MPLDRPQTAPGFRTQLLARLRNDALKQGVASQRLQQRVAFERLLARLVGSNEWVLKGGFALQLRYDLMARPTKDIDLRTGLSAPEAPDRLRQRIAEARIDDHFTFELGEIVQEMQGAPGGSSRVRVTALIAGVQLTVFHVDLASGDALVGAPDVLRGSELLEFAGIEPVEFPVYPVAQHLAEKLHAYTLPRDRENTRVKDILDLVVVAALAKVQAGVLRASARATFQVRGTHALPDRLPAPPGSWASAFKALAREIPTAPAEGLEIGYQHATRFWDHFSRTSPTTPSGSPIDRSGRCSSHRDRHGSIAADCDPDRHGPIRTVPHEIKPWNLRGR